MADPAKAIAQQDPHEIVIQSPHFVEKDRIFVNPPLARIGSGKSQLDHITFRNSSGDTIWVWLPNGHHYLDKTEAELLQPVPIENGRTEDFPVKANPEPGLYAYHVYCKKIHNGAEGHSEPHVGCP